MARILILGVRGHTGSALAPLLRDARGDSIHGTARDPGTVRAPGVVPVAFDWQRPDGWGAALAVEPEAVYIARPEIGDAAQRIGEYLAAATSVRRVVLLSEMAAERAAPGEWVTGVERAVTESGAEWTILRPASFFQLLADERYLLGGIRDQRRIDWPSNGSANAFVDARDIAAVAARVLREDGHAGASYTLTGPESLTFAEVAARVGRVVGADVRHVDVPLSETVEAWSAGLEPWLVDYLYAAMGRVADGRFAPVSGDVERVTGAPPRGIDAFIEERAEVWRGSSRSSG